MTEKQRKWREIRFQETKKGMFLIIEYYEKSERTFILCQVTGKTTIRQISESPQDRVHPGEIEKYFSLWNYSIEREISIEKDHEIIDPNSGSEHIQKVILIQKRIINEMMKKKIKEEKKKMEEIIEDFKKLKKNIKTIKTIK